MTKKQISANKSYTVKQAAVQLNTTPLAIRKAIHEGRLKAYKISQRNTRVTQESIDEFRNSGGGIL